MRLRGDSSETVHLEIGTGSPSDLIVTVSICSYLETDYGP